MTCDSCTARATERRAVLRFTTSTGALGPTLCIEQRGDNDYVELWAPGGELLGTSREFTLLGLLNAACNGREALDL